MHALSLMLPHVNLLFALSYLGGVSSGNIVMGVVLGLATAGVIVLNTVAAWTGWAVGQRAGYGDYQFFFFGWRTLDEGWHKFFLLWQIGDSMVAFMAVIAAMCLAVGMLGLGEEKEVPWYFKYPSIPIGAAAMLIVGWPLILWTELIVSRNGLESETDMIAVWLFIAQVVTMLLPSCGARLGCFKGRQGR
ncbi:hypothetical protein MMYC01_207672 [Madurella mycetomatis]|uniref:Uncharacterized protein n=1 Tax=Madurella mycetomatis TaxID=100816 RepID=A0A175W0N6_9PEZI|nr:hypothetical protein MMYC01_207672 [Madurella mycetomatis]